MSANQPIEDFKQLRVYRHSFKTAMRIFQISKRWPKEEQYALTDQIRRSSRSVCANIAEAWFKRRYPKHFASKLSDAGMEASETIVWLDFATECGYLSPTEAERLNDIYYQVIGGLTKMMSRPEQWCVPPSKIHEDAASYELDG